MPNSENKMPVEYWKPDAARIKASQMYRFMQEVGVSNYAELHQWSIDEPAQFWSQLFSFFNLKYTGELQPAFRDTSFKEYTWFPKIKLNFAENLLRYNKPDKIALNFVHESGIKKQISYQELGQQTAKLASFIKETLGEGDVLAAFMPHIPETVVSMLAATSLGGIFTSTSCDFGAEGVIDRLSQSKPKVLVAVCGYEYNGKYFDCLNKIKKITDNLPMLQKIIVVDFLNKKPNLDEIENAILWDDALTQYDGSALSFKKVRFDSPVYILYSSGTSGKPKCIVHSAGGTLIQHVKELGLHCDLTDNKNIFFFTTCGWMMWNWLVSSLALGATITIYEGSPGYPSMSHFIKIIDREKVNIFGTSPKYLKALADSNEDITSDYPTLETILSTGAPLLNEQYDFVYHKIKNNVQLSSIAGGTDIVSCFVLGNPMLPVNRGEIQCLGLGMNVSCFNDEGEDQLNQEGEMVCKQSFPSRPICFLNDQTGKRIENAYFNQFPGVWCQGDYISITDRKTVIIHGRSDTTLNPGGVRIGTAEIYRQTEPLHYIEDSLCVGRTKDGDVELILFVMMKNNESLDDNKIKQIKSTIRQNTTPRHVPIEVYQVNGIPYTSSGKKMELPITRILAKKTITNLEAVANPECLKEYEQYQI